MLLLNIFVFPLLEENEKEKNRIRNHNGVKSFPASSSSYYSKDDDIDDNDNDNDNDYYYYGGYKKKRKFLQSFLASAFLKNNRCPQSSYTSKPLLFMQQLICRAFVLFLFFFFFYSLMVNIIEDCTIFCPQDKKFRAADKCCWWCFLFLFLFFFLKGKLSTKICLWLNVSNFSNNFPAMSSNFYWFRQKKI